MNVEIYIFILYDKNKNQLCQELVSNLIILTLGTMASLANQAAHNIANVSYDNWNPGMGTPAWTGGSQ